VARGDGRGDDTDALQAALERCSGAATTCVLRLCAGVFHTRPVRVRDFRGVLRGAGRNETVLRALPDLAVNDNPDGFFRDDPLDPALDPWPFLVQLVGGHATVRDLALEVPTPEPGVRPTRGWLGGLVFELAGALLLTGSDPVDFEVQRVRVEAGPDSASSLGTTLLAGVYFEGLLFDPADAGSYPVLPLSGRYRITDSELLGMVDGTPLAELAGADVVVMRNRYRALVAMDLLDAERSRIAILSNRWEDAIRGVSFILNLDGAPSLENQLVVAGNRGSIAGGGGGVVFQDPFDPTLGPGGTTLQVAYNTFNLGDAGGPAVSGVSAIGPGLLRVVGNTLRGQAGVGIDVDSTSGCYLASNGFRGLDTAGGPDLHLGPATRDCLAIVGRRDVVVDEGTGNEIVRP
jgi:hypothetical protein